MCVVSRVEISGFPADPRALKFQVLRPFHLLRACGQRRSRTYRAAHADRATAGATAAARVRLYIIMTFPPLPPPPPGAEDDDACEVDLVESHEIRVEIILPDDDACPIDPFLAAPSLDVEDLLAMKCSFSENWEWLPTTDGGERLKNAMTTVVSTLSSPSFQCSFAGKNEAVEIPAR